MKKKTRKKTGGRKKGTPNKRTLVLEQILEDNDFNPIIGLVECLEELDGVTCFEPADSINVIKAKAGIYTEMLQYIYPKRKPTDGNPDKDNKPSSITILWGDADGSSSQDETSDATTEET